jgi:hypothetical protein
MEERERLARLGRAAPSISTSTGTGDSLRGRGSGDDGEQAEVQGRQKESLLVQKAKALQEVRECVWLWGSVCVSSTCLLVLLECFNCRCCILCSTLLPPNTLVKSYLFCACRPGPATCSPASLLPVPPHP